MGRLLRGCLVRQGFFQAAKVNQKIKEEKMNIDIVDRMKQIEIQENEIERRSRELGKGSSKVIICRIHKYIDKVTLSR